MSRVIQKAWGTKKGKSGTGLSGAAALFQCIKWGFEWAGTYQTMAAALPEWLLSPLLPLLIFVSGILLLVWAVYERSEQENDAEPSTLKQETIGAQSPASATSGSNSPITNIGTLVVNPQPPADPLKEPRKTAEKTAPQIIHIPFANKRTYAGQPQPKIADVRIETCRLGVGATERQEMVFCREDSGIPFAVVHFRNKVGGISAYNVKAQITFYDKNGGEILSRLGCSWLENNETPITNFVVGDTPCLIVIGLNRGNSILPYFKQEKYDDGWSGVYYRQTADYATISVSRVEINLIGENDEALYTATFDHSEESGVPNLVKRLR